MDTQIAYMIIAPSLPLAAMGGLRYLFAVFLRESSLWFADITLSDTVARPIADRLALTNGLIFATAAFLSLEYGARMNRAWQGRSVGQCSTLPKTARSTSLKQK